MCPLSTAMDSTCSSGTPFPKLSEARNALSSRIISQWPGGTGTIHRRSSGSHVITRLYAGLCTSALNASMELKAAEKRVESAVLRDSSRHRKTTDKNSTGMAATISARSFHGYTGTARVGNRSLIAVRPQAACARPRRYASPVTPRGETLTARQAAEPGARVAWLVPSFCVTFRAFFDLIAAFGEGSS